MIIRPMLATASTTIHPDVQHVLNNLCADMADWTFEPKYDGVRCIATVHDTFTSVAKAYRKVTLNARSGSDLTEKFPEVVAALQEDWPAGVYDGELVSGISTGTFGRVSGRVHLSAERALVSAVVDPARYLIFDYLGVDANLRDEPHYRRSDHLLGFARADQAAVHAVMPHYDGQMLMDIMREHKGEGLIAKKRTSRYTPGRSPWWIKLKIMHSASLVVTGYQEGKGSRKGKVGALNLAAIDGADIVPVGKVGTGFTDDMLGQLMDLIDAGQPFIVEVEYQSFTDDNKLRFPSFKGVRHDLTWQDASIQQLKENT